MEMADQLIGITMQEKYVSRVVVDIDAAHRCEKPRRPDFEKHVFMNEKWLFLPWSRLDNNVSCGQFGPPFGQNPVYE